MLLKLKDLGLGRVPMGPPHTPCGCLGAPYPPRGRIFSLSLACGETSSDIEISSSILEL